MSGERKKRIPHNILKDRRPVLRYRAGQNIVITLLSFAFSVSATRLFLELTGYPQLGGGELHIAHVLWGGVLLFAAALIPTLWMNEWAASLAALISGLGVGLFIDEVGKFITSNNDYFFPSAAPIVYVFFLLTVLLASRVRLGKPKPDRAKMYEILERFSEVLDRDLSAYEREDLLKSLAEIKRTTENQDLEVLAASLQKFLIDQKSEIDTERPNLLDRIRIRLFTFERKFLKQARLRSIVVFGLFAWGVWALLSPIFFFSTASDPVALQSFLDRLITNNLLVSASGLNWFEARVLLEGGFGLLGWIAAILILLKREKPGFLVGIVGLLVSLTVVNLLVFYFEQFSTITVASLQFLLLLLLFRYKQRFLS